MCKRGDPCATVHVDADLALGRHGRHAGVQADANPGQPLITETDGRFRAAYEEGRVAGLDAAVALGEDQTFP